MAWEDGMNIKEHWPQIKSVIERGQRSMLHCAIASISPEGTPHLTPIGTVFIRDNQSGYFFDKYTNGLARNIEANANVCLMAVDARPSFWFRSFFLGRFISPPGVRLYGKVGALRSATPDELTAIQQRVKPTLWLKGSRALWSGFTHVRNIDFTEFKPVMYPVMMEHLWQSA
jgi:uncharacterized protein